MGLGLVGREPHRPAPHALRAERHRGSHLATAADAPGAEDRDVDRVDDLGDQHHRTDLAGVAAGLGALGDDQVDARGLVALGVLRASRERTDQPAFLLHPVDQELRRRAECVGDEGGPVGQRDLELWSGRVGAERRVAVVARDRGPRSGVVVDGQFGHLVAGENVVDELPVRVGDEGPDVVERVAPTLVAGVLGRHDQVDAVRPVADLRLDPGEVDLQLLGRVGDRAEHTEAAGLRHRGDHVAAVAEGEDRELDVEHFGGGGLHGRLPLLAWRPVARSVRRTIPLWPCRREADEGGRELGARRFGGGLRCRDRCGFLPPETSHRG